MWDQWWCVASQVVWCGGGGALQVREAPDILYTSQKMRRGQSAFFFLTVKLDAIISLCTGGSGREREKKGRKNVLTRETKFSFPHKDQLNLAFPRSVVLARERQREKKGENRIYDRRRRWKGI